MSMGSALGRTLANIFLCHHEEMWLDNCPIQFNRRYVDYTFVLFRDKDQVNKFNKYLNSRYVNMRFSNEVGNDLTFIF